MNRARMLVLVLAFGCAKAEPPRPTPSPTIAACLDGDHDSCVLVSRLVGRMRLDPVAVAERFLHACTEEKPHGCYLGLEIHEISARDWWQTCDQMVVLFIDKTPNPAHALVRACEVWKDEVDEAMDRLDELAATARAVVNKRCDDGDEVACVPFALDSWRDRHDIAERDKLCAETRNHEHFRCFQPWVDDDADAASKQFINERNQRLCNKGLVNLCRPGAADHGIEESFAACQRNDWVHCFLVSNSLLPYNKVSGLASKLDSAKKRAAALSALVDTTWDKRIARER